MRHSPPRDLRAVPPERALRNLRMSHRFRPPEAASMAADRLAEAPDGFQ